MEGIDHYVGKKGGKGERQQRAGFTLLESLLTIGVVAMLLVILVSAASIFGLQQNANNQAIARQLLAEESEALREASFADLENRSNTPFIEVAYNTGRWAVEHPTSPDSAPAVYAVASATGSANPSRQVVPMGSVTDGTVSVAIRVRPTSSPGWKTGFAFRYHDDQNHYLLQISETQLQLVRIVEGAATSLWSTAMTFDTNTWYRVEAAVSGPSFTVSVDGVLKTLTPVSDETFAHGQIVLTARDAAAVDFDTIAFTGFVSFSWNFDSGETPGVPARGWRRLGTDDLPSGATRVTIADAMMTATDLKLITMRVQWTERGATRALSNSFYINQRSVPQ